MSDKRQAGVRVPCDNGPARLTIEGRVHAGTIGDLNVGGCYFTTDAKLPIGARGTILRDGAQGPVNVRVVRVGSSGDAPAPGVGLAFDD